MSSDFKKGWNLGWKLVGIIEKWLTKPNVKGKRAQQGDKEVLQLINHVNEVYQNTETLSKVDPDLLTAGICVHVADELDLPQHNLLTDVMMNIIERYAKYEGLFGINDDFRIPDTHEERSRVKKDLNQNLKKYQNEKEVFGVFVLFFEDVLTEIFNSLPRVCIADTSSEIEEQQTENAGVVFDTHILNLIDDVYELVHKICNLFYHEDLIDIGLFDKCRDILQVNGIRAAGWDLNDPASYHKVFPTPSDSRKMQPDVMVSQFLKNTPFPDIFLQKLPFQIPASVRFEHMHALAGSGHGKTQLLQKLILDDLNNEIGFCIIDSQGDLISKLLLNHRLSPEENQGVSDKVILIDASDVEYPTCLNLFAMNKTDESMSLKQKEILANGTVDLYTYIFSSLLGADLTARQGTMFVYIAKLMMEIPDASIQTLRQLMEDGEQFRPYMDKLQGSAGAFFKTQFFSKTFAPVKSQILYRLWAVLSNSVLERMFSGTENKVDLYEAMNEGKIVLINTSKQVLGKIGSEVMGKFFIAMLTQSAMKRAAIDEEDRRGFHIYIDEAQEYVDDMFNQFLNQTRKYKCAFHLFHQNYDQLSATVRASILSSTSIKFAGGVSSKDAKTLSDEMKISPQEIMQVKKYDRSHSEYSLYVQNVTPAAVTVDVKFGLLENEDVMSLSCYERLIAVNREKYCKHISEVQVDIEPNIPKDIPPPEVIEKLVEPEQQRETQTTEQIIDKVESQKEPSEEIEQTQSASKPEVQGKGGVKHKYLQAYVSRVGNEFGFQAMLEEKTPNGKGFIDVVLKRDDVKIACEISVTTPSDYEMKNIQKCIDAGYENIIMLGADGLHLQGIYKKAENTFNSHDLKKINFLLDDAVKQYLSKFEIAEDQEPKKKVVSGWEVRVNYDGASQEDQEAKRKAVTKIMMGTMK